MSQNGGMMLPPVPKAKPAGPPPPRQRSEPGGGPPPQPLAVVGSAPSRLQAAPPAALPQLSWVPKLYYWMKNKYAVLSSSGLTQEPIWLLGVCHHMRHELAQQAAAAAPGGVGGADGGGSGLSARLALSLHSFPATRLALGVGAPAAAAAAVAASAAAQGATGPPVAPDVRAQWFVGGDEGGELEEQERVRAAAVDAGEVVPRAAAGGGGGGGGSAAAGWSPYPPASARRLEAAFARRQRTADLDRF